MLANGGDPNITDNDGDTPLHVCETRNVAEILLSANADPYILNNFNQSIYDKALEEENLEMIEFLREKGLNTVSAPMTSNEDCEVLGEDFDYGDD